MRKSAVILVAGLLFAGAAHAQQPGPGDTRQTTPHSTPAEGPKRWQFWLKGQGQLYDNFFQATEGAGEENVSAMVGEVGASVGVSGPVRAYGSVNTIRYDDSELGQSHGVRLGLRSDGKPHSFDVYVEQLNDRPSFEVGDEFDRADVRNVVGEYGWRFHDDWQLSVDGELQQQEYELTANRDNDWHAAGAAIRWRGMRAFSPEIGFRTGQRDVDDATQSYDQDEAYLQIRSSLTPALYLSLRLRNRMRDYSTDSPLSSNFGREDTRRQLALSAVYSLTKSLAVDFYGAHEKVDTNRTGRDFDTALWALGLTWKF